MKIGKVLEVNNTDIEIDVFNNIYLILKGGMKFLPKRVDTQLWAPLSIMVKRNIHRPIYQSLRKYENR